ncbi:uncharacterized protein B0P05DRAFT_551872 [Gilbertella persicaria]|uniref:uncharacterized protein n=1 Tax=Gilbertella persicaria TaxID=101096 RepID=UPI0022200A98|nr:uncharacterized protein B0P05DRAFT_551872 [Gilbertella persicaria]KAI8068125.1 hypothetical protein B0P05DRAFT_551872 [Gilbertella persicaria]
MIKFIFLFFISLVNASVYVTITNETFEDRPAVFGPRISSNGKMGYVVEPSDDPTGCGIVQPPCSDWIALVKRGGCSFITKVRYMQKSGAVAVIVGDAENPGWITMYSPGDTSDVSIPSVFVAKDEYTKLLQMSKLLGTPMMSVLQRQDTSIPWPWVDIVMILFLVPAVMVFFVFIFWKIRQKIMRKRELAPVSVVSKLAVKVFSEEEKKISDEKVEQGEEEEGESCAICLEEYGVGDELRLLPCHHQFHTLCVDAWLTTQKKLCPICKRDITCNLTTEITPLLLESGYA